VGVGRSILIGACQCGLCEFERVCVCWPVVVRDGLFELGFDLAR